MNKSKTGSIFFLLLVILLAAYPCSALELRLVNEGNSVYSLYGSGLQGVGGVDVTVFYDTASFGTAQVSQGGLSSGSFFASNTNIPGQIRLALVHATGLNGNGVLASISFSSAGKAGALPSLKINSVIDTKGAAVSSNTAPTAASSSQTSDSQSGGSWKDVSPSGGSLQTSSADTRREAASAQTAITAAGGAVAGTITMPQEFGREEPKTSRAEASQPVPQPQSVSQRGQVQQSEAASPPVRKEPRSFKSPPASVLERFSSYKGIRSVKALAPLFANLGGGWITQKPSIAVSDGKSEVSLLFNPGWVSGEAPAFALRSLEMKSLKPLDDSSWELVALPAKGVHKASVSIELEEASANIQLTVVPPLNESLKGVKLTEAEVDRLLGENSVSKSPRQDINGDGKKDYIDDYILIGHYLLAAETSASAAGSSPLKAEGAKPK